MFAISFAECFRHWIRVSNLLHPFYLDRLFLFVLFINPVGKFDESFLRLRLLKEYFSIWCLTTITSKSVKAVASIVRVSTVPTIWILPPRLCTAYSTAIQIETLWKSFTIALVNTAWITYITFLSRVESLTCSVLPKSRIEAFSRNNGILAIRLCIVISNLTGQTSLAAESFRASRSPYTSRLIWNQARFIPQLSSQVQPSPVM